MAAPHWLEVHSGYEDSPRGVRWLWRALGVAIPLAGVPAALWLAILAFVGAWRGLEFGMQQGGWWTIAAGGVLAVWWGLRRRLPG